MLRLGSILEGETTWENIFLKTVLNGDIGSSLPKIIAYYPPAKINPFQDALYSCSHEFGYVSVPLVDLQHLHEIDWPYEVTLHLHWLGGILKLAQDEESAREAVDEFMRSLEQLQSRGIRIIWTIHNVLPHRARFPKIEASLREALCTIAEKVHILTHTTQELIESTFRLEPKKIFYTPHPSYRDYYKRPIDKSRARAELNWGLTSFYFLFFGGIDRYKGIDSLIGAFRQIRSRHRQRDLRLVIVGPLTNTSYAQEIIDLICPQDVAITLIPHAVSDADVHLYFSACDVVVMPYTQSLNSGVALLAANFERPIVAPKIGAISEIWCEDSELLYPLQEKDSLMAFMEKSLDARVKKSVYAGIQKLHDAAVVSRSFFSHLTPKSSQ